jgi:hypothetical protein
MHIHIKTGFHTQVSGKRREAAGWVSEGAKNSAAVHGIVNPNTVDAILSHAAISKSGIPLGISFFLSLSLSLSLYV